MKVLQVGFGECGSSWMKDVLLHHDSIQIVGLVDKSMDNLKKAQELCGLDDSILFNDLRKALSQVVPDFIFNITPPGYHKEVDLIAFEYGLPVLSEKPIAESYHDAFEISQKAAEKNIPIMIAENYRYNNIVRSVKKLLSAGEIGKIDSIQIDFQKNHKMENYHKDLEYPLLLDVAIHHIDMIRFLTGLEAKSVFAKSWTPSYSWYKGYSNLNLLLDMEEDIRVSYCGSLSSFKDQTDWYGNWRFEGQKGILKLWNGKLTVQKDDSEIKIDTFEESDTRKLVLDEFILSISENRPGETDIKDNIKTFSIVQAAIESSRENKIKVI